MNYNFIKYKPISDNKIIICHKKMKKLYDTLIHQFLKDLHLYLL